MMIADHWSNPSEPLGNRKGESMRPAIVVDAAHALHRQAEYTTASGFDHRRDRFVADFREESIYILLGLVGPVRG